MSIHIHTFPWYYFSFLIIKCIYATPKHPRQQAECWLMRLTFLLKLLMVRCRLGFFFLGCFFFFFGCLYFFLFIVPHNSHVGKVCWCFFFFFSRLPFSPHFLDLEFTPVEPAVRWARWATAPISAECLCLCLNGFSHLLQKMNMKCLSCRRILGLWAQ